MCLPIEITNYFTNSHGHKWTSPAATTRSWYDRTCGKIFGSKCRPQTDSLPSIDQTGCMELHWFIFWIEEVQGF